MNQPFPLVQLVGWVRVVQVFEHKHGPSFICKLSYWYDNYTTKKQGVNNTIKQMGMNYLRLESGFGLAPRRSPNCSACLI
jgi:hypothetical protein